MHQTLLGWVMPWGIVDLADIDGSGLIRVFGWSHRRTDELVTPAVAIGDSALALNKVYRTLRGDVPVGPPELGALLGFVFEYRVSAEQYGVAGLTVRISVDGQTPRLVPVAEPFVRPVYDHLFGTADVLARDQIYGFGPPALHVNPEVLAFASATSGTVLDLGCGAGALVAALRELGREAYGLEIDRPPIRQSMLPAAAPHIRLYDGAFPMPFADKTFDVVICSEVLEHIVNYRAALVEMARLCRRQAILTVPDMSAIPLCYRHGVVPWHLLESTHVNFFTQESLAECLRPHFARVTFGRMGMTRVGDTAYFVSLVASCEAKA